mgnify:CR=1 FL=1
MTLPHRYRRNAMRIAYGLLFALWLAVLAALRTLG